MTFIASYLFINAAMAVVGTLITVYAFLQRFLKDQLLVSEVMASLAIGVVIGPAGFNLFNPLTLSDEAHFQVMIQVSKLVIAIQLVSAGLSLPMRYVQQEWLSLVILIGPVMVLTWILSFGFAQAFLSSHLSVLQALLLAATLTPTDPVLASTILQGKFAEKHLPAALRNILSCESGANDGFALPFVGLPMLLLNNHYSNGEAVARWFWDVWCWQVLLAVVIGLVYGLGARLLMHIGNKYDLIDEPSHLAHIIGMALGTLGFTHIFGSDGILSVFVAAVVFSMYDPTAEEQMYDAMNGIELILTISYFIYFGTTLPYAAWNKIGIGRLLLFSAAILIFRRLPFVVAFAETIPEFHKWPGGKRAVYCQAAFAGFFGPLGVGAIFYAAALQESIHQETVYEIVSFVVVCSVVLHGISAAPCSMLLHHLLQGFTTEEQLAGIALQEMVAQMSSMRSAGATSTIGAGSLSGQTTNQAVEKALGGRRPSLNQLKAWSKIIKDSKKSKQDEGKEEQSILDRPAGSGGDGRAASDASSDYEKDDEIVVAFDETAAGSFDVSVPVDELARRRHRSPEIAPNGATGSENRPRI